MPKWRAIRVRQELVEEVKKEVEKGKYQSLSEFISESIQLRLQRLAKERISEYLERDRHIRTLQLLGQLFYTPKHVWVKMTPQGNVRIGISDYFQRQLREVVNVRTDEVGENVSKVEPFGVVETWWFIHDLYSPIDGKIVKVNKTVIDDPFMLNGDPYEWIVEIQPNHTEIDKELNELLSSEEYKKLTTKLEGHLEK